MAGTLSAVINIGVAKDVAFSGDSLLAAQAIERYAVTTGLTGSGVLNTPAFPQYAGSAALSGGGTLMCNVKQIYEKLAALFGGGTIGGGTPGAIYNRTAALTGAGALSATATKNTVSTFVYAGGGSGSITSVGVTEGVTTGDMGYLMLFNKDGGIPVSAPATPSGWTSVASGTGGTAGAYIAFRLISKVASVGGIVAPSTSASEYLWGVYRAVTATGAVATASGAAKPYTVPALTLQVTTGTSQVAVFVVDANGVGPYNANLASGGPRRAQYNSTADVSGAVYDANGGVTSWSATTTSVTGSPVWDYRSVSVEMKA